MNMEPQNEAQPKQENKEEKLFDPQEQLKEELLESGVEELLDISIEGGIANIAIPLPMLTAFLSITKLLNKSIENEQGVSR